ncbi:putative lipase [Aspergillus mulundensis]|uniref:Lipase B n=1 Tax=Aspergillus mulundensis TaxID=1810919 RepID=A0A3D8T5H3_9EURO|nr:Uncharacterized protein DSM5745_00580 [Aspergillus mulundensis]RDW93258.1 Uncharacterized protein DSM5745_00580 [Aspergillus mulundensis]
MRVPALVGAVLAHVIIGSASPVASAAVQRDNQKHDLASIFSLAAVDPSVEDNGLLSNAVGAILNGVTGGKHRSDDQTVEEAWETIQVAVDGKTNLLDIVVSLALALPGDILNLLNGYLDFELNSVDNKNAPLTKTSIYPSKAEGDAPYSVSEEDLRTAIYIPETFQYGKNGKKPVILVPGTAVPGGLTWYYSFGKLADAVPEADVVWLNIPGASLADVQVNAEYVAYAINYISAVSDTNVAVLSWSQGGLNIQWSFKYWPSTRDVVDDFIAISPDFRGTVVADAACPLLSGIYCTPALFQQRYETTFIEVLRADGGDSAYVPTTTLYSSFDEIVQPQSGENASAILNDARGVGVTNNHAQTVCAGQPGGGVYLHEGMLYNPLSWALAADALRHDGPGDVSRIDTERVCADIIAPQLGVDDLLGSEGLLLVAVAEQMVFDQKPFKEGPIASYAHDQ